MDLHPRQNARSKHSIRACLVFAALAAVLLLLVVPRRPHRSADRALERGHGAPARLKTGAVFVLYSGEDAGLLRQTVRSLLAAGWRDQVLVLDNSPGAGAAAGAALAAAGAAVLRTSGSLGYAQLQNVAGSIALERGLAHYFWAHPGALVLGPDPATGFRAAAERCAARLHADAPDWGLAFFGSDRFVAVRGALAADVRWDVFIPGYRADCDFYQSVRVSGWSLQHCRAGRVVAAWQHLQLMRPQEVDVPYDNHTAAAAALDAHDAAAADEGEAARAARAAAASPEERVAWAMQLRTSYEYYQYKWRTNACDMAEGHLSWQAE